MTHTETLQRKGEKLFLLYFLLIQLFNFTEQLLIAFGWLDDLSGHGVTCSHRAGAAEDVEVCCPGPMTRLTKPSAEEDAGSRFQFFTKFRAAIAEPEPRTEHRPRRARGSERLQRPM